MITRRLFLLASGLPFLPKFGSVKKKKKIKEITFEIVSLCCSDDNIQSYQQRCFERGAFPSFSNYKKMNYDWIT